MLPIASVLVGVVIMVMQILCLAVLVGRDRTWSRTLIVFLALHLSSVLLLQSFGLFSWGAVVGVHGALALTFLYRLHTTGRMRDLTRVCGHAGCWSAILVFGIAAVLLLGVHVQYDGIYNSTADTSYYEADGLTYLYPSFPDEWYAIAFMQDAIASHALPLRNPMDHTDRLFVNAQFPFHALLAAFCVLFNVDPLHAYVFLSILSNSLLITLLFALLRHHGISTSMAAVAALLALLIPSGANFPGLWTLIPFTFGILVTILILFESSGTMSWRYQSLALVLLLLLYPPLLVVVFPGMVYLALRTHHRGAIVLRGIVIFCMGSGILIAALVTFLPSMSAVLAFMQTKLWYQSLLGSITPILLPHTIVPLSLLVGAMFGIVAVRKHSALLLLFLGMCVLFWLLYAMSPIRVIIGYERIVLLFAVLITIVAGFGFERLYRFVRSRYGLRRTYVLQAMFIGALCIPFLTYDSRTAWQRLIAFDSERTAVVFPGAPIVVAYVTEDTAAFAGITRERFLSVPWKGTVISTITDNIPVVIQPGTITINPGLYATFRNGSCAQKRNLTESYRVEYVYVPPISCAGFTPIRSGSEGLVLYHVER